MGTVDLEKRIVDLERHFDRLTSELGGLHRKVDDLRLEPTLRPRITFDGDNFYYFDNKTWGSG